MTDTLSIAQGRQTDGTLEHVGRLIVRRRLTSGVLLTVTLPDDMQSVVGGPTRAEFDALVARVAALEAKVIPNSIEDLTYAG